MASVKRSLNIGAVIDGVTHKKFEMRDATIQDAINAVDKANAAGANLQSNLTMRIYKSAEQMISLGTLPAEDITAQLLLGLDEEDFEPILEAQDDLEKKRKGLKSTSSPTST